MTQWEKTRLLECRPNHAGVHQHSHRAIGYANDSDPSSGLLIWHGVGNHYQHPVGVAVKFVEEMKKADGHSPFGRVVQRRLLLKKKVRRELVTDRKPHLSA